MTSTFVLKKLNEQRDLWTYKDIKDIISRMFGMCSFGKHKNISNYESGKVPIELFKNKNGAVLKKCADCRKFSLEETRKKRLKLIEDSKKEGSGFLYCPSGRHTASSEHPRDKVPVELFKKFSDISKCSLLFKECKDCRDYTQKARRDRISKKKTEHTPSGHFLCNCCHKFKKERERYTNLNGGLSNTCEMCKKMLIKSSDNLKDERKNIRKESIMKYGYSCRKCKSIFLKPEKETLFSVELKTRKKQTGREVIYKGRVYKTKDFVKLFGDLLETRFIEFDHLPEDSQRKLGVLNSDDVFEGKTGTVASMRSKDMMKLEALKCQHLCSRCHIIITESRYTGNIRRVSLLEKQKRDFANKIKIESNGCCVCGSWDETLLRFYEFDHVDKSKKVRNVSDMIKDKNFSVEDIISECKKCRVICRHCHFIHSSEQRNKKN